jgi:hypothetical protein
MTLRRREIFAINSSKWGDPGAKLLQGPVWEALRPTVLASLRLPERPIRSFQTKNNAKN